MAEIVAQALAAWRLASMLVDEDGPGGMFAWLRRKAGLQSVPVRTGDGWQTVTTAANPLAELFACVWCLSVWTAAVLALRPLRPLRLPLAGSALAILLHEAMRWLRSRNG